MLALAVAQAPSLQKWQLSALPTSTLGNRLHAILGPVYYETTSAPTVELPQKMPSSVKEGTVSIPEEV